MLNGKATIVLLIVGLIKKAAKMSEYFPKPKSLGANVKVELDLSNYATKADLKNATGVDTLKFAAKVDLASLKLVSAISYQIVIFSPNDSPSKTMKNVFYFI